MIFYHFWKVSWKVGDLNECYIGLMDRNKGS